MWGLSPRTLPTPACMLPWEPWRQKRFTHLSICALYGVPAWPAALPALDDRDDVIHLNVQLIWLLKVLKGPHVSGLSLGAETGHCSAQGEASDHPTCLHSPETVGRSAPHLQQEVPKGHKCGSVLWLVGPALDHDIVDVLRAVLRPGQALPFLVNLMQDLPARVVQRLEASEHLPPHFQLSL